ncbi:MAG: protein TolR [Nevskiaceae bacterium]
MTAQGAIRRKRRLAHEINVVPYIDVMLVLLIIFMITAPLLTQGVEVDLPETGAEAMPGSDEPVTLTIDAKGRYYLDVGENTRKAIGDDEVVRRVRAVIKARPDAMILIKGDTRVDYGRVAYGMGLLQEAGATKLGFISEPAPRREPAPASGAK